MKNVGDLYRFCRPCDFLIDPGPRPVADFQRKGNIVPHGKNGIQRTNFRSRGDIPGCGGKALTCFSSKKRFPSVISSSPAIIRKVNVLPHPEGPRNTKNYFVTDTETMSFTAKDWSLAIALAHMIQDDLSRQSLPPGLFRQ